MDGENNQFKNVTTTETMNIWSTDLSRKNIVSQELVDVLYTKEEVALLNEWVSPHEINTLNELFGRKYIMTEYATIINRLRVYNELLEKIEVHDKASGGNPYKKILVASSFMNEPFNNQRKRSWEKLSPYNKKIDGKLLIDLFSQDYARLLSYKMIDEGGVMNSTRRDFIKEHWNWYIFSPKHAIYVDLHNHDSNIINERWIKETKVKDDSLRFLALLPNDCANYILSWFDDLVMKSYLPLGKEYLNHLTDEITRTMEKGWIITWMNFERNDLLESKWMKDITAKKWNHREFYAYEKE